MSSIRKPGDDRYKKIPDDSSADAGFSIPPEADDMRFELESFAAAVIDFESSSDDFRGAQFSDIPLPAWEFGPNDIRELRTALMARPAESDDFTPSVPTLLPFLSLNTQVKNLEMVVLPIKAARHGALPPSMNLPLRHSHEMMRFLRSAPRFMEIYRDIVELLKALHVYQQKKLGIQTLRRYPFEPLRAKAAAQAIPLTPSPALFSSLAPSVVADPVIQNLIAVQMEIDASLQVPKETGLVSTWVQDHEKDIPGISAHILEKQGEVTRQTLDDFLEWLEQYRAERIPLVSMMPSSQDHSPFDHSEPFSIAFAEAMQGLSDSDGVLRIVPTSTDPDDDGNEGEK